MFNVALVGGILEMVKYQATPTRGFWGPYHPALVKLIPRCCDYHDAFPLALQVHCTGYILHSYLVHSRG